MIPYPEHFVEFHHYEKRIAALESTIVRYRKIFSLIHAYVKADIEGIWEAPARALLAALDDELKE